MHRSRVRTAVTLAVLALLVVAGCGTPNAPSSAPPSDAAAQACQQATGGAPWHGMLRVDGARATLDAFDDYFSPNCLVVPPGRSVVLVLTDRGHVPHTLAGDGVAVAASVDAGETAFVTLPPLARPTRLVCGLHQDEQMVLAVVPAGGSSGDV